MEKDLISVIIPVYNSEQWIERCIHSIQNNTYRNLEIICINDGSMDGSMKLLRKLQSEDSRIVVVDQKNGGVSAARNAGLRQAHGEYIAFVDSDDWVHRQYFEVLKKHIENDEAGLICCECKSVSSFVKDEVEREIDKISDKRFSPGEAMKNFTAKARVWGKIYRASAIGNIQFDEKLAYSEDLIFNLSCIPQCGSVLIFGQPIYFYCFREGSLVSKCREEDQLKIVELCKSQIDANSEYSDAYADEAIKLLLAYRYGMTFTDRYRFAKKKVGSEYRKIVKKVPISAGERVIYSAMFLFPLLYRMYRISTDKTLLVWERIQREKRKNQKN